MKTKTQIILSCLFIVFSLGIAVIIDPSLFAASIINEQVEVSESKIIPESGQVYVNEKQISDITGIKQGDVIKIGKNSKARIEFSDDSVSRLSENSKIIIEILELDKETNDSKIKIKAITGEIWSKIIKIISPNSSFEVATETTVAAVRGSAFDFKVSNEGYAEIIAAEHNIQIEEFDKISKKSIGKITLKEGKKVDIKKINSSIISTENSSLISKDTEKSETKISIKSNDEKNTDNKEEITNTTYSQEQFENIFVINDASEELEKNSWFQENKELDETHVKNVIKKEKKIREEAAGILPGSIFYQFKEMEDTRRLKNAKSEEELIKIKMGIAERKLIEAEVLLENNEYQLAKENMDESTNTLKKIIINNKENNKEILKQEIKKVVATQKNILKTSTIDSKTYPIRKQVEALEVLSAETKEEANQITKHQIERKIVEMNDAVKKGNELSIQNEFKEVVKELANSDIADELNKEINLKENLTNIHENVKKRQNEEKEINKQIINDKEVNREQNNDMKQDQNEKKPEGTKNPNDKEVNKEQNNDMKQDQNEKKPEGTKNPNDKEVNKEQETNKPTQEQPRNDSKATTQEQPRNDSTATTQEQPRNDSKTTTQEQPRNDSTATTQEQPRNDSKATTQKQPRNDSTATTQEQPRNDSKSTTQEQPRNDSKATTQEQPRNDSKTTTQEQPRNDSKTTTQEQPRNDSKTTTQEQPRNDSVAPKQ